MESITFNTTEGKITVKFEDQSTKDYFDRSSYLADWPDREADCDSMGWA